MTFRLATGPLNSQAGNSQAGNSQAGARTKDLTLMEITVEKVFGAQSRRGTPTHLVPRS